MAKRIKGKYLGELPEPVSLKATEKILDQMNNDICRIYNKDRKGTGFFVRIPYESQLLPVLITSNNLINKDDILNNSIISLNINNDKNLKKIKLDNNRKIYSNEKFNITIIEIKEKEDKLNNKYLELDNKIINYFKLDKKEVLHNLNNFYSDESIYILNHLKDNDIVVSYGKLNYLHNKELFYQCNIKENSSSLPILLTNNQKLIGIHSKTSKKYNKGSLIIYLIKEFSKIKNNSLLINKERDLINNYIIGELDIKEDNQNIRIINSYEQYCRESIFIKFKKYYENELEIQENCEIRINDELIPFSYFHKFNKKGKYKIKYTFLLNITKTDYMFSGCSSLTNIDLSNFNSNNVINMSFMFSGCSSLSNINLSNFNSNNVINMSFMFSGCSSLSNINLSNFNTNNVNDMSYMFYECSSLKDIDLSNFNTNNVTTMSHMFYECSSLKDMDLSNFDTNNVNDMSYMFYECSSLEDIDLSNFNSNNVNDMSSMFFGCSSLTNIDLSNFNTNNVNDMSSMFSGCSSLKDIDLSNFNTNNVTTMSGIFYNCKKLTKNNIITNDKKLLVYLY